jgi:hypothetical protein
MLDFSVHEVEQLAVMPACTGITVFGRGRGIAVGRMTREGV